MITESSRNRQKKLYRAGLIVGLAGVVLIVLFSLAISEAPFSMYAVPTTLIFSFPFLVMVGIAWKQPATGGILLIVASLFWAVWRPSTMPTMPLSDLLYGIAIGVLPISVLPLISGILFLLSKKGGVKVREGSKAPNTL